MDLKGQIVDTKIRIKPSETLVKFIRALPYQDGMPINIAKFIKDKNYEVNKAVHKIKTEVELKLNKEELKLLKNLRATKDDQKDKQVTENKAKETVHIESNLKKNTSKDILEEDCQDSDHAIENEDVKITEVKSKSKEKTTKDIAKDDDYSLLSVDDVDWLYAHLQKMKQEESKNVPYLHELLKDSEIETPANAVLKRNPDLEARCVKLRAQQETREYRAMTKGVDNVRIRFPEDSISYQLKQLNRQLIAVGQFLLSIFAGFLFGFKGVELMLGGMDFGFRLLLGVMCALVIALAEIYFLAKKLNEELSIPETTQIGGPPKFANSEVPKQATVQNGNKEHQE